MKKEIIEKIELLVEMSGTVNSYDTLNEELLSINQEIDKQKIILRDLKKSMTDNKYLKANERIIDENIKMGLENRLGVYYQDLKDLEKDISLVSIDEEYFHDCILSLEEEVNQLKSFLESLELKMKTIGEKDPSIYSFYDSLITKTNDDLDQLNTTIEVKKREYESITLRLEQLGNSRSSLEHKIKKEEERLEDVRAMLTNPNSYIDYRAKKADEIAIDKYIVELESLEHKRLEILTDPAYIGHEAKELYFEDDKTSSLAKIRELVTIIQSKPFMDVAFDDLNELLDEATNKRDELANIIENKSYNGEDVSIINMRVLYLENLKNESELKLKALKEEISNIDLVYVKDLVQQIEQIKETRNNLNEDILTYKKVIQEDDDQKTPKKKAALKSALKKKMEELEIVENILNAFEQDLEKTVIKSKKLEEEGVTELQSNIVDYDNEISAIKKRSILNVRSKDILSVEKDKEELKKLSDDVQNIMNRKKYSKTPKDIFDEIEMAYGTDLENSSVWKENNKSEINLDDYRIETPLENEDFIKNSIIEETPIENELSSFLDDSNIAVSLNSNKSEENQDNADVLEETVTLSSEDVWVMNDDKVVSDLLDYPPRSTAKETNKNRFKVIQVEPIDETNDHDDKVIESLKEDDMLLSDFEDTDYISFNDLLTGDMNEN